MDIRSWRAGRDRRYNRLWWPAFVGCCCLAVAIVATIEDFNFLPWLIVGLLVSMILRRRRHHREQALSDARVDAQAKAMAEAKAQARQALTSGKAQGMLYWLHVGGWSCFPQVTFQQGRWQGVVRVYAKRSFVVTHRCTFHRQSEALALEDACVVAWKMVQRKDAAKLVAFGRPELDDGINTA